MRRLLAAAVLLLFPASVLAGPWDINPAYCDEDGISEVPTWGGYRDSNNCLVLDTGNGDGDILFQQEFFHLTSMGHNCALKSGYFRFDWGTASWARKPVCQNGCASILIWDTTFDNYNTECKGKDTAEIGSGTGYSYMYFKDVKLGNTWDCKLAHEWTGPEAGMHCAEGAKTKSHMDGIQLKGGVPRGYGWVIFQDMEYYNGYNYHGLYQDAQTDTGSIVFQGVEFGRKEDFITAEHWITDCSTGFHGQASDKSFCTTGEIQIDSGNDEIWIVDTWSPSNTPIVAHTVTIGKVVVVNTGCSTAGCGGSIGYTNGWVHPLKIKGAGAGPGTCPNGQIYGGSPPAYCYTSLEEAEADGQKLPPFMQYSEAGWASGAPGAGLSLTLDVSPNPVEVNTDFTLTAVPNNGTSPYTVTWDCDADGNCDDGTPDSTSPYSQVCSGGFSTAGSKTVKACVTDDDSSTASRTENLTVVPVCGNDTTESPEFCDGTDLNGDNCTDVGYTGGTLACESDCSAYDVSSCTGAPTCGDDTCTAVENTEAGFCFEDCADFEVRIAGYELDGWNWIALDMQDGDQANYRGLVGDALAIETDPVPDYHGDQISAFRYLLDGSAAGFDNGGVQNSPIYAACGDDGSDGLQNIFACDPVITPGSHTLAITPCNANFTNTTPPILDGDCPDKLGPTKTITIDFVNTRTAD